MKNDKGYIGKLFVNKTVDDGKIFPKGTTYLRGTINGVKVVAFPGNDAGKDYTSFNVKEDIPLESKKGSKKGGAKKSEAPVDDILA